MYFRNAIKCCIIPIYIAHITFGLELYGLTSDKNLKVILVLQQVAILEMLNLDHNNFFYHFSKLKTYTVGYMDYIFV